MYKVGGAEYPYVLKTGNMQDVVYGDFIYFDKLTDFEKAVNNCDRIEGYKPVPNNYKRAFTMPSGLYLRKTDQILVTDIDRNNILGKTTGYV